MGILDEDVAAVRAASDLVGIVSQYQQLRKVGRRWVGLCPFHSENTPSFSVNGEAGLWYCFGCQAKGDVITFVRDVEHLDFVGAVEWLAGKANMVVRYTERNEGEGRKRRARLVELMEAAVEWYHQRLLSGPDAGAARSYLRARGLDGEVVRAYRIGWAPDAWDDLCRALRLNEDDARDTGLGFRNSRNRLQDSFRARVMFPIGDDQGHPVSFGGRILPGGEGRGNHGKYKNTPETPLYHKSKVLYGLDRAKGAIVSSDTAVVCEGYTDVIGFHRSGVPTAVATCGTALTDDHVKLLRRFSRRLVLAFDADGAGMAAAERFYQWERDHDLEVAVADLPVGQDPGDLGQSDPERLAASVEGARPFLRFRLDRAFAAADLTTPEGRARAAERAVAIVAEHPTEMVRDQYLMDVAGRCRLEPDRLRPQLEAFRRDRRAAASAAEPGRSGTRGGTGGGRSGPDSGGPGQGRGPGAGGRGGRPERGPGERDGGSVGPDGSPGSAGRGRVAAGGRNRGRAGATAPGSEQWSGDRSVAGSAPSGSGSRPADSRSWAGGYDEAPGYPDDWIPAERGRGAAGRRAPGGGPGRSRYADPTERPALEVLRHAVHHRDDVASWLRPELFMDPRHQALLDEMARTVAASVPVAQAITEAAPDVADLWARLVVDEPGSEPFDAVRRLATEVARASLGELRLRAAADTEQSQVLTDSAVLGRCIADLRDPEASIEAIDRLVAFLGTRSETGDD